MRVLGGGGRTGDPAEPEVEAGWLASRLARASSSASSPSRCTRAMSTDLRTKGRGHGTQFAGNHPSAAPALPDLPAALL